MTREPRELGPAGGHSRPWLLVVALLGLGFAVYGNALRNPFIIDDTEVILNDVRIHECRLSELLTGPYWPPPYRDVLYRPLAKITFALNWAASHEAWTFRLPNLLLHIGVSFMVYLLTRELSRAYWPAVGAAVLFVIHPIHTEVLNTIVGRTDLGASFFGLLAVWLYRRNGEHAIGPSWLRPILATLSLAVALLFKESALTLVGAVVLLDPAAQRATPDPMFGRWLGRRTIRCYAPMLLVVVGYLAARDVVLGGNVKDYSNISLVDNVIAHPEQGLGPGDSFWLARWGTPLATFGLAVRLMAWPRPMAWDYSYATIETVKRLSDARLSFGAVTLLVILVAMGISCRRRRFVFAALGIMLVTYSLVSNVFVIIGTVFAERLLYLPSVGMCMFAGLVIGAALEGNTGSRGLIRRVLALLIFVLVGGSYGWLTVTRNRDWSSRPVLDAADLRTSPRSCRLLAQMGHNALERRDPVAALAFAEEALSICPGFPGAWRISGLARNQQGDPGGALLDLKRSFELGGANHELANVVVAEILVSHGDYAQSIELLRRLVSGNPLAATAQNNLAWYLITAEPADLRGAEAALAHAETAMRLHPHEAAFLDTYVSVLVALGRRESAIHALEEHLPEIPVSDPGRADLAKHLSELEQQ